MAPGRFSVFFWIGLFCFTCTARDALYSGQTLGTGESLTQGGYSLIMQTDCNLVLYSDGPLWASGTYHKGVNCYAAMQYDGNFVVYSGSGAALWASGTNIGNGYYVLIVQPDRNLVIYGPALWATSTNAATAGFGQIAVNVTAKEESRQKKPWLFSSSSENKQRNHGAVAFPLFLRPLVRLIFLTFNLIVHL